MQDMQTPRINAKCHRSGFANLPLHFAVELLSSDRFSSTDRELGIQGQIPLEHGQMIQGLMEELDLKVEVLCSIAEGSGSAKPGRCITQKPCCLAMTIYGPYELFDEIGTYFQDYNIHLQDPINAINQDVKYCNPHRLSVGHLDSCLLVSECVSQKSRLVDFEEVMDQTGFLEILSSNADLEETRQPSAVRTVLKR